MPSIPAQAIALYEAAFPEEERRPTADWLRLMDERDDFHAESILQADGSFAGILTHWSFEGFRYVEHLATLPSLRGKGIGGKAIRELVDKVRPTPVLLEVEPPADEITKRRIRFYERHGFSLVSAGYIQPPYRPGGKSIPLRLMCTDKAFAEGHIDYITAKLHTEVYGADKARPARE